MPIDTIIPDAAAPLKATWFSGELTISLTNRHRHWHLGEGFPLEHYDQTPSRAIALNWTPDAITMNVAWAKVNNQLIGKGEAKDIPRQILLERCGPRRPRPVWIAPNFASDYTGDGDFPRSMTRPAG
ncbi:hypothetical protein [Cupriavidus basilensis]|uniref:hypothetical protein n=1 Tax=Cupriavidus basilensis TaxID=68895 RepID=UPI00157B2D78|nr:hypothetical protein [Cupriavidus basilensis]